MSNKTPAIFLDRDGVLINDCHYISKPKDVTLENGAKETLKFFKDNGWLTVVITNQSGIARGYFNWEDYYKVTERFLDLLQSTNLIDAIYANGCLEDSESNWRKPNPGMLLEADIDLNIDLKNSILVGDRISDIKAGIRAGLENNFHILTGHGKYERKLITRNNILKEDDKKGTKNKVVFVDRGISSNLFLINNLKEIKNFIKFN